MTASDTTDAPAASRGYRTWVLFMLVLVYTFNFIDRQIIGILAGPIKAELNLTDTQLGLMGGLAFALFYTALGVPIAWLADRKNRTWIITVSLAVWSGFTALCGAAQNFWQLFGARVGVGVGEAGGVAPSYALISDYFPPQERARALAIFSFGIPIGSAAGILFGGLIAHAIDWRMAFVIVGLSGLLLAPLFKLTVKEPPRGQFDAPVDKGPAPPFGEVVSALIAKPSFWLLSLGAAASSIVGYGLIFWLPSFFERSFDLSLVDRSLFYGAIVFFGGVAGIWLGGVLGDKFATRSKGAYAAVPALAFVLALPFYVAGVLTGDLWIAFFVFLVPQALSLAWIGPVVAAIQGLVAPGGRAVASAIFLFVNNLIGIGLGTVFFGLVSDLLSARFGDESLRYAILIGLGFYGLAALLMAAASRTLPKDWR